MAPNTRRHGKPIFDPFAEKPRLAPKYNVPLPWCQGPKLSRFPNRKAAIQFIRLLSDPDSEGPAHVFEVEIASRSYALKVFKYYDDESDLVGLGHRMSRISLDILHAHSDPFYNECRAYGRLVEMKLNGKVAARCHGYITLPAEMEGELWRKFQVGDWDRPEEEYDQPVTKRQALRAIVKDLIQIETQSNEKEIKRMLTDLKRIRRQGIFPMDIFARNYKGGLLVDLSSAITEPHFLFNIMPDWRIEAFKNQDRYQFDAMVNKLGVITWWRAAPNRNYLAHLRKRKKDDDSDKS
ncbi:MAG: hypothetical protein Q9214_005004 [Letrouitia sp. 1 TL-2023]